MEELSVSCVKMGWERMRDDFLPVITDYVFTSETSLKGYYKCISCIDCYSSDGQYPVCFSQEHYPPASPPYVFSDSYQ